MAGQAPQYRKGPADAQQLPQGEATDLNAAVAAIPKADPVAVAAAEIPPAGPPPPHVQSQPDTSMVQPPGEDDSLLFGPTGRPDEHISTGQGVARQVTTPADIHRWLPALVAAAQDPTAPSMYKDMLKLIQFHQKNGS